MSENRKTPGVVVGVLELMASLAFGLWPQKSDVNHRQYSERRKRPKVDAKQLIDRKETIDVLERIGIQDES